MRNVYLTASQLEKFILYRSTIAPSFTLPELYEDVIAEFGDLGRLEDFVKIVPINKIMDLRQLSNSLTEKEAEKIIEEGTIAYMHF
jgi:hypothetical protein